MKRNQVKLWVGLGSFVLLGGAAVTPAAAGSDPSEPLHHGAIPALQIAQAHSVHGATEGGEGGEEGSEGDVFMESSTDVAFLGRLLLIEGHLMAGRELYQQGRNSEALPHFLHPVEENYGFLEPELAARGVAPFKEKLDAAVKAAMTGKPYGTIAPLMDSALAAIAGAKAQPGPSVVKAPEFIMDVVAKVLEQAADEYQEAVTENRISNIIEYQDSWGFVRAARQFLDQNAAELKAKDAEAFGKLVTAFDHLMPVWPTIQPPKQPVTAPGEVRATVSRIQLLQSSFR